MIGKARLRIARMRGFNELGSLRSLKRLSLAGHGIGGVRRRRDGVYPQTRLRPLRLAS